jgi:hypothetical protein
MEIAERFGGKSKQSYASQWLTRSVDGEQACENIVYARAQNSEVYLLLNCSVQLLT